METVKEVKCDGTDYSRLREGYFTAVDAFVIG
jgi:hypothetical protein